MEGAGSDIVLWTAAGLAFFHTAIGIDHVLPFAVIAQAQGWSWSRTLAVTAACGVGHVASSVLIGALGFVLGLSLETLTGWEAGRGALAASLLIGFGLLYATWALWRLLRSRRHEHAHAHGSGVFHSHEHDHHGGHLHPHGADLNPRGLTTWGLFILFVFGPCEALIPLMMAPAAAGQAVVVVAVVLLFGGVTIATMLAGVALARAGLSWARWAPLERYVHVIAGLTIALSGAAVKWAGL